MKKTNQFLLLMVVVLSLCLWSGAAWAAGVPVSTAEEFAAMEANGSYVLEADITITAPWGDMSTPFQGNFNGNGHKITLDIQATTAYQGVFAVLDGATVENLLVDGEIRTTLGYAAGIAAKMTNSTVRNCGSEVTIVSTGNNSMNFGGITGWASGSTIEGCYSNSAISGKIKNVGGIAGQIQSVSCTIRNCYNLGNIVSTGTSAVRAGGIVGNCNKASMIENCYTAGLVDNAVQSGAFAGYFTGMTEEMLTHCFYADGSHEKAVGFAYNSYTEGILSQTKAELAALSDILGDAYVENPKGGYPLLAWQLAAAPEPAKPSISIASSNGNILWVEKGGSNKNDTVLKVSYKEMGEDTPAVTWSIDDTAVLGGQTAENSNDYIVTAKKGGVATVTATVEYAGESYTADYKVTVIPQFTTATIKNIAEDYAGNISVGQTVAAVLNTADGIFDPADYPGLVLTYQWYRYEPAANKTTKIPGAIEETYRVTDDFQEWDKIGVAVYCNGKEIHSYQDGQVSVRSLDYGRLYPIAYGTDMIHLPADVKEEVQLALPSVVTKDDVTVQIEWSGFSDMIAADGRVTRPETGKREVVLQAKFIYQDTFCNRNVKITVWSEEAAAADANDKQNVLKAAIASLGNDYTMYPVYGKDINVNTMLAEILAARGYGDIAVSVKAVTEVYGGAGITDDGEITYFYADPNQLPTIKHGSYQVTFTLEKDGVTLDYADVPVIIYWDRDLVKAVMTNEILAKVTLDADTPLTENINLPKVVDEKRWVQIDWQSSDDRVVAVSKENQTTADTLFAPYVGVVKRGQEQQTVTLTAAFTFQLTNDVIGREEPMVLYKTFTVTVAPLGEEEVAAVQKELLAKLDRGFAAKGLQDAVTGEQLIDADGVYTVSNDIQLPTTRDFGVDGKYYPITITGNNEIVAKTPDVANAARVEIYRPGVGQPDATVTITVTMQDKDTSVTASRSFVLAVAALTEEEVLQEQALMAQVKAAYFDGLKGKNTARDDVRTDLVPFQEVYQDVNGVLVWVRNYNDRVGYGIIPTPIEGWEDLELWRLFKSSNPNVISHETLEVTRQPEAKGVTVTSYLSSETLGRYGALYQKDPVRYGEYANCAGLYYQEVSTDKPQPAVRAMRKASSNVYADGTASMVVRGTKNPDSAVPVVEPMNVSFVLLGLDGAEWIPAIELTNLDESSTVYDVFTKMLTAYGYTATRQKGTYIVSVSGPKGALAEKEYGERSGWMYRVNGKIPDVYMGACALHDGDVVQVFYTRDAKKDDPNWTWNIGGGVGQAAGGSAGDETEMVSVERDEESGAYIMTLPQNSEGWQKVTLSQGKPRQLVVKIDTDGVETVIKKSLVTDGKAKFFLASDAVIKLVDYINDFTDVSKDAWYGDAVDFVAGRELFSGVGENCFAPEETLSRGMFITALYRLEEPEVQTLDLPFTDVPTGAWYEKAAVWGNLTGIAGGDGDGAFRPDDAVTREELAAMLYRYGKMLNLSTGGRDSLTAFADGSDISDWAQDAVAWAVDSGIINGDASGNLAPQSTATRAEAAAMIQRFIAFMVR